MNFSIIKNIFSAFSLVGITALFFYIIWDFIFPIFFAIALAIVFYPLYKKVLKIFKNKKNLASTFSIFIVLFLIMVPVFFISSTVVKESAGIYKTLTDENKISSEEGGGRFDKYEEKIREKVSNFDIDYDEAKNKVALLVKKSEKYITTKGLSFGKDTFSMLMSFLITIYIMFYLFRDGKYFLNKISKVVPLGNENEKIIFSKFRLIIKSIFKGTMIVALIQGLIGGFLFYIVGIKAIFLWTILMIILSIIPALGPPIVLIPTAILMFLMGEDINGYVLLAGSVAISISDNILRPIFIGNSIKMHDLFLTLSILGGISVFGILGFIIGPVIAGVFILSWEIFEKRYNGELINNG